MKDPIESAIKKMWNGVPNTRFDCGDCLEWAVAIHGALTDSVIDFVFEPPPQEVVDGATVKSHFLVKKGHTYYDHRGVHTQGSWNWDASRTLVQRVTPEIIRAMTLGGNLVLPGQKPFNRTYPFNEILCGVIAQEFLLHYRPPVVAIKKESGQDGSQGFQWSSAFIPLF